MDAKNKIIEEDANSIARKYDMCYRKQQELLKLVEFYGTYSSLAERNDDAKGQQLQVHRTTREASPSQVSFLFADDAPSASEPHTPFNGLPIHAFDPEESGTAVSRKGLKHQEEDRKGLAQLLNENQNLKTRILIESERARKTEIELQTLTQILTKTEGERDAIFIKSQQISGRLSNLMKDIVPTQKYTTELQMHANMLNEQIGRAKDGVEVLKKEIVQLKQERENVASLYNHCMEIIHSQQNELREAQEQAVWFSNVIHWGMQNLLVLKNNVFLWK
ncbi:hypothetical protein Nepgr_030422 [Nepenthes gracilis]|uniref:Uncharacterized protein n=1 Tax=Nepenthes gracilis TaxID=150966 RepID=A0AAD3TGA1_NEPGR|nr:hypothetical protein Nepgr_030422 [Nepenthes gracilis]